MSDLATTIAHYRTVADLLTPETRRVIETRLAQWSSSKLHTPSSTSSRPWIMRPGLPPRPLDQRYFSLLNL